MKKRVIITIIAVSLVLSSCFLWNATMDNVIRTYNLEYGLHSGYEYSITDFSVIKTNDSVIFSKSNDYDPSEPYIYTELDYDATCTEIFRDDTGSEPGSSFSLQYFLMDMEVEDALYLNDGTPFFKTGSFTSIAQQQSDPSGNTYFTTRLGAVKDDYGYFLNQSDNTLDVYDIGTWFDSAAVNAPLEIDERISSQAVPGITDFSGDEIMISGDNLAFSVDSAIDDFHGLVFFDINEPANPSYLSQKEPTGISDDNYYHINYHLEGDDLCIYGRDSDAGFFYIWDVSDPTDIPAATDISTEMEDFADGAPYPHLINGRLAVYYNIYEPVLDVWDFSDLSNILQVSEGPNSTWAPDSNRTYPWDSISLEGDRIYIPAGNNIEVWQYNSGSLDYLATGYVGVPLLGAYKFPDDPYVYALGYDSINVVSVKY